MRSELAALELTAAFAQLRGMLLDTPAATDPAVEALDRLQYEPGKGPCPTAWDTVSMQWVDDTAGETRWPEWAKAAGRHRAGLGAQHPAGDASIGTGQAHGLRADRDARGMELDGLWLHCFRLGEDAGVMEVEAYLHHALPPSALQRDLLAYACNELADGRPHRAPCTSDRSAAGTRCAGDAGEGAAEGGEEAPAGGDDPPAPEGRPPLSHAAAGCCSAAKPPPVPRNHWPTWPGIAGVSLPFSNW